MNKLGKIIELLFYLFIFLLPWQTEWIWHYGFLGGGVSQYLTFGFYGTEILLLIIFFLGLIYRSSQPDPEADFVNWRLLNIYLILLVFFVYLGFNFFASSDQQLYLFYLLRILEGFALFIFILNFRFYFANVAWALVGSGFIQALLAVWQFISQTISANKWLGIAEQISSNSGVAVVQSATMRWLRAYGSLPHPNILAGFLAVCLIIILILLFLSPTRKEKIVLWIFLPIILSGLFFTFSKSAFLALIIGVLFIAIFIILSADFNAKLVLGQFILISLTVFSLLAVIYQDPFTTRVTAQAPLESFSLEQRALYLQQTRDLLTQHWLTGVGLGHYTLSVYEQSPTKQPLVYYQPVHNVYLLIFAELGIGGILLFMFIIIEGLLKIWHFKIDQQLNLISIFNLFKDQEAFTAYRFRLYWFLGYSAIFLMFLTIMFFDHYLWTLFFGIMLWWLFLGLWLKAVSLVK